MPKQHNILLVEDEESLATGLEFNLEAEGYKVTWVKDGRTGLEKALSQNYDLIILDIMLPHVDGFEVAEKVRRKDPQLPILMLTARSGIQDRLKGLELGADDYLSKPFHLEELLLRIEGMLRRKRWYVKSNENLPEFRFGQNHIDFRTLQAVAGNRTFRLTPQEAVLMKYFIEHKNEVVSRKELLENVWQVNPDIETRTVDNFITRLRKYFEPHPGRPAYFKSVRGAGYIFTPES
jgi:DNA-binding response OmpR family regulator